MADTHVMLGGAYISPKAPCHWDGLHNITTYKRLMEQVACFPPGATVVLGARGPGVFDAEGLGVDEAVSKMLLQPPAQRRNCCPARTTTWPRKWPAEQCHFWARASEL